MTVKTKRVRRPASEAKARILEAAETQLIEGGPSAVRVQVLARSLGVTDAAIYHHFGSRDALLSALLRFEGRRLRDEMRRITSSWEASSFDLDALIDEILQSFDGRGYARLAMWLWVAGYEIRGRGFFDELVQLLLAARSEHARRLGFPPPTEAETRRRTALLAATLFGEPIFGEATRRSVSLPVGRRATTEYRTWLAGTLRRVIFDREPG
ncbi:MAG: TetR/AcrR family transcriptional regulator [Polyangiales bacterium]